MDYYWNVQDDGEEHRILLCDQGNSIRFYWEKGYHDIVHMYSEANYVSCNFN